MPKKNWILSTLAYLTTFSRRSLSLIIVFTALLIFCFIFSSHAGYQYRNHPRNHTHLLSNTLFSGSLQPPVHKLTPKQVFEACMDRGTTTDHYLSIVVVFRNDDYAGSQIDRVQNMIDSTYLLAEATKSSMELLMIEWNPLSDKRRIKDMYRFRRSDYLTWRIITLPQKQDHSKVYEFEGKNVGIRHARGEFIVCTNQDDIWSNLMYHTVMQRSWKRNTIYTQYQDNHRYITETTASNSNSSLVKLSDFPKDQEIQASCNFTLPNIEEVITKLDRSNYLRIGHEASDFTLAHRDLWHRVGGYRETGATIWMDVEFLLTAFHSKQVPITYSSISYNCHQSHRRVYHPGAENDNQGVQVDAIIAHEVSYANEGNWGLSDINLFDHGIECSVFRGGMLK